MSTGTSSLFHRCAKGHLAIAVSAALLLACSGNGSDEDPLYRDVKALFSQRCSGSACHIAFSGTPAGDLDLNPGLECSQMIGVPALEAPDQMRVDVGNSAASYLVCKLEPDCSNRPAGSTLMPLGSASGLPAADLDVVVQWVDQQAPGCAGPDEQAPTFAGAVSATPLPSAIQVQWQAASDDNTAPGDLVYLIYQADSSGGQDFAQPTATTRPGATEITMGGLPVSTRFFFVVRARDARGNVDDNTVEVSATTPAVGDETAPDFAGVETMTPVGSSSLNLGWSPASDDVSAKENLTYRIYVAATSKGHDFTTPTLESAPGVTETLVSGLTPATTYYVVVRAVDQVGNEDANTVESSATTGDATSFADAVEPIFVANCTSAACHAGPRPAQDLDLRKGQAYGELVDVPSTQCANRIRVEPGDAPASYVVDKLMGTNLCREGGTKMPKTGSLSPVEIQLIVDWINEGALDN